ncbi:hypothetical protein MJG53_020228 [Ovis ammon polii x Ovis aries]|uniref:Uncharacterized protein n=1 Tax=Ovis ammon polii x Ovis aries TaxID=2918886 RepID=A0ACB9U1R7_9CETA|nr:hypothetical protein MJG53_020228 [Ovis ammon polii x Ovis aries]
MSTTRRAERSKPDGILLLKGNNCNTTWKLQFDVQPSLLRVPDVILHFFNWGHGGPQATVEEEWDIEPLEEEESDFELEDLGEEEHLEDAEYLLDEVEEEETLVDEESEQGGAAVVAGDVDPLEQFVSVFWALVHSLLHSFSYDDHGLIWPLAPARWSGTAPGLPQALQSVLRLRRSRKT